jgi:glycosyltransferase involved in cell wall biosynthesis
VSWRILIANVTLGGRTGTEVVTRDLALGLQARGHRVSVYAPGPRGPLADELLERGVPVVADLGDAPERPEIVHGHHSVETVEALDWAPAARGVFVCHDRTAAHSTPLRHRRILRFVAVDHYCLQRLRDDWAVPADRTRVILNAVDLARLRPRPPLPARPARALVFSHYASPLTHPDVIRAACEPLGIRVDVAGGRAGMVIVPEERLADYDLVFAKGRSALEAMAVGTAVVLCDASGMGPTITTGEVHRLRQWNFGARLLTERLDGARLAREIERYDPVEAAAVSRVIRETASLDAALDEYEAVYREVLADVVPPASPAPADANRVRSWLEPLLARMASLEAGLAEYRRPDRMSALSDEDVTRIHLAVEKAPSSMAAGASTWVQVRVTNRLADRALGTWPPFPLQFGCRWRRLDGSQPTVTDAAHTPLAQPVPSGESRTLAVRTTAPAAPGRYQLRVVLVQEWWRWLDETPTPVVADCEVAVVRPTLLTSIGGAASRA